MNLDPWEGECAADSAVDWFRQRMELSGIKRGVADVAGIALEIDDNGAYFRLPYFTVDAVITTFYRQRNRTAQKVREKDQSGAEFRGRYTQPKGRSNRLYWPPLHPQRQLFNDPGKPLIICEGELKALRCKMACAESAIDALVCGVPGTILCDKVENELQSLLCKTTVGDVDVHRLVVLALDWGGAGKGRDASLALAARLRDLFQKLGAKVINLRWDVEEDHVGENKLDEWLTRGGDLSAALASSLADDRRQDSELQGMWDHLNSNYAIRAGYYIPLRDHTQKLSGDALNTMECNTRIPIGKNRVLEAKEVWKLQTSEDRNIVHGYTFHPAPLGQHQEQYVWKDGLRLLNTAPEALWESNPLGVEDAYDIAPFIGLLERLFQGETGWYLDFLAHAAQRPMERGHHVIILQDDGNTGKDRLFDTLDLVFGPYSGSVGTGLTSAFNANLEHLVIAHWSDPVLSGRGGLDRVLDSVVKNYSGTSKVEINHKGGAKYSVENYGRLHIAHNQNYVLKMKERERRYAVFGGTEVLPHEQAVEYMQWLTVGGGVEHVRRALISREIKDFDVFAPAPRTTQRVAMEKNSRSSLEMWIQDSPVLSHKDVWEIGELQVLWEIESKNRVSCEMLSLAIKKMPDTYKVKDPIKAEGKARRLTAIRNGSHWAERHSTEGNDCLRENWKVAGNGGVTDEKY